MKLMTIVGLILIVVGLVALIFNGIPYQSEEESIRLGPIKAEVERQEEIPLPRILGIVATAGGVVLLIFGRREPKS